MHTVDERSGTASSSPRSSSASGSASSSSPVLSPPARPAALGQAARAGVPTIPLQRESASRTARPTPSDRVLTPVPASASIGVSQLLRGPVRGARIIASGSTGLYLHVPGERGPDVVGVLTSDAARLPLGCVLFRPSNGEPLVALPPGGPASVGGGRIVVGNLVVSAAAWWNPRPKLPHPRPALLPEGVRQLRSSLYGDGVPHSAFTLPGLPAGPGGPLAALRGAVRRADLDAALRTAVRLVGVGPGLTPAGDDVMAGTMAGLVLLDHPEAERFAGSVVGLAAGRTNELSRALLRHAAVGEVSGEYTAVLQGLVGERPLGPAIAGLLAGGSISGRATALGLCTAIDLVERTTRNR